MARPPLLNQGGEYCLTGLPFIFQCLAGGGLRKGEEKCASGARLALNPDFAAVLFDNGLGDGQPKSSTQVSGYLGLPEQIKDPVDVRWLDSATGVADGKTHLLLERLAAHGNASTIRSELQRIIQQVQEYLKHAMAIRFNERERGRHFAGQADGFGKSFYGYALASLLDDLDGVLGLNLQRNRLSRLNARNGDQILNQTIHACCRPLDDFEHVLPFVLGQG